MTGFKQTWLGKELAGAGIWLGALWTKLEPTVNTAAEDAGQVAEQVAVAAGTAALAAGAEAHAAGGSYGDVRDAVEQAALGSIKTVGVTLGTQEIGTLTTLVTHALTAPADEPGAPAPQAGTAA